MDTVFGLSIIAVFVGTLVIGLKQLSNPKPDFSGNLEKEKESYEFFILKFINDIKSIFKNQ